MLCIAEIGLSLQLLSNKLGIKSYLVLLSHVHCWYLFIYLKHCQSRARLLQEGHMVSTNDKYKNISKESNTRKRGIYGYGVVFMQYV